MMSRCSLPSLALLVWAGSAAAQVPLIGPGAAPPAAGQYPPGTVVVKQALVTAIDDVKVPAREAGAIAQMRVKGGELIEAGAVLGDLDNRDSVARMKIAQAEFSAAKATAESNAEVDAAVKASEVAKAEWDQLEDLRRKNPGAVSLTELRRAGFQYERALAQIAVAKNDKVVAGHNAEAKTAQMGAIDVELERRKILSPLNGQVIEVLKHNGEWCTPGEAVVRVLRLDRLRIEGFVRAKYASPSDVLRKPVEVLVYLPGGKKETVAGVIVFASPVIEGSGDYRSFRVWTEVDNKFAAGFWTLQPGAEADMTINIAAAPVPPPAAAPASAAAPAAASPLLGAPALSAPAAPNGFLPLSPAPLQESRKPVVEAPAGDQPAAKPALAPPASAPAAPAAQPVPPASAKAATTAPGGAPASPPKSPAPAATPKAFQPTLPKINSR